MTLPRTCFGLAAGLSLVAALAWRLGGTVGTGALLGYLLGAGLSGLGVAWQAHWLQRNAARAGQAQIEAIGAKFLAVAVFALAFRYVEPLAQSVDWQAFLLAFAAAVLLVLPLSTWDLSKLIASGRAQRAAVASRRST